MFSTNVVWSIFSAGNNSYLLIGHLSFKILLLVGHLTKWDRTIIIYRLHDNTLKKITQDVLVWCSVIVRDHNVKLRGHFQSLGGQCPVTNCYFQH